MLFLEMVKLAYTKLPYNLELEPYSLEIYTGCAKMNFVKAFKSYLWQTDRQTDTTEIIHHAIPVSSSQSWVNTRHGGNHRRLKGGCFRFTINCKWSWRTGNTDRKSRKFRTFWLPGKSRKQIGQMSERIFQVRPGTQSSPLTRYRLASRGSIKTSTRKMNWKYVLWNVVSVPYPSPQWPNCSYNSGYIAHFSLRMHETAIFPLPILNLASTSCSSTQISSKTLKFRRFAYI